jgi:hypothetical protein
VLLAAATIERDEWTSKVRRAFQLQEAATATSAKAASAIELAASAAAAAAAAVVGGVGEVVAPAASSAAATDAEPPAVALEAAPDAKRARREALMAEAEVLDNCGRGLEALARRKAAKELDSVATPASSSEDAYVRQHCPSASVEEEVREYMRVAQLSSAECKDVFGWWASHAKKFPTIALVARRYLIVPATSVDIERLFSKLQAMIDPQRSCLRCVAPCCVH